MGVGQVTARELDNFVRGCDELGGVEDPRAADFIADFELIFKSVVDENLNPFGDAYFNQQMALYTEISGREVDQETGEISPIDPVFQADGINPYRSSDLSFMSRHVRAISTAMMVAQLRKDADILDVGSGWGLSSEIIAYCGGQVTSVDINPLFVELVRLRARKLGLPIDAVRGNFDEFQLKKKYDAAFFYECLHHALRSWVAVENVGRHLKPGGKIIFAGEPIFDRWINWGMRLDAVSVYCIRKFGWMETGWSRDFITRAFERAGFKLELIPFVGLDNGNIGIASRVDETASFDRNLMLPFDRLENAIEAKDTYISALENELHSWRNRAKELQVQVDHLDLGRVNLEANISAIHSSTSWRITRPIRKLSGILNVMNSRRP
ncbi:class I SAM-dependent methyltransferase (plasmid) [Rhizobium sp. CB3060]|uniref:class I SAM-dependent methyltransferase n=1 Tax=Rhizobium sp. CB3060 TaxID=3138255 RepID=UPI0021A3193C|nr:class I SAM-dependent methyltransferase [Rhizobium tropici]UWU23541.1 class I SAM-dependent methyltransferase [Rhizobium tropici]